MRVIIFVKKTVSAYELNTVKKKDFEQKLFPNVILNIPEILVPYSTCLLTLTQSHS